MWHYAFFTAGIQSKMTETCVMREPENRKEADRKRSERFMLNAEKIKEYVAAHKEEALGCLAEALQSPSPTGSEKPMGDTMLRWLEKTPFDVSVHTYMKDRPNIIAAWKGKEEGKDFLFNGHLDVFPPTESDDPDYDPWSGKIVDGRIYGRGACDMKGGDCAALIAMKFLREMGFEPKGNIFLTLVSDEENGGAYGIQPMLEEGLIRGDIGISMEPSCMEVVMGNVGIYPCHVIIYGDGGHAGWAIDPEGPDNRFGGEDAIRKGAKALKALYKLAEDIDGRPETFMGKSRLSVTLFHAGTTLNNYPRRCMLGIDRRYMPGETAEQVRKEIEDALESVRTEDPSFEYELIAPSEPATPLCVVPDDCEIMTASDSAFTELLGRKPERMYCPGGADSAFIHEKIGVFMPFLSAGSTDMATTTESIDVEDYLNIIMIYMLVLVKAMS